MKKNSSKLLIVFSLILVASVFPAEAQRTSVYETAAYEKQKSLYLPQEVIFLHLDRDKYIAGEEIWFSIYTSDRETGAISARSIVSYVELLNPWNIPVIQSRFQLSDGTGKGNFTLPDTISSGTFTVRAYTSEMKNYLPGNCFMQNIDVLNSFGNQEFRRKEMSANGMNKKSTISDNLRKNPLIITADTIFGRREKVTITLKRAAYADTETNDYDMSISVVPSGLSVGLQDIDEDVTVIHLTGEQLVPEISPSPKYFFESSGHFLTGRVRYRQSTISDSSGYLYMSVQGKVAEFRYADTDSTGRFTFIMPVDSKQRNLILQPQHANNNMILEIEPSFSWILPSSTSFSDTLRASEREIFSDLSLNYQTAKIFGISSKKETVTNEENTAKKRRFYGIPEMEIKLRDYIMLPTMQEVFYELVTGVLIRERKTGYEMRITNPLTGNFYDDPPLVMIDGVIINDLAVLLGLDPETVEKIEVVKTPYLIGDLILHGIVNVITKSGNFSKITMPEYAVIMPYKVADSPDEMSVPDYSDEKSRLSRKPDLRNTLYWNPAVRTDKNGEAEIVFWTSDLPGEYTIIIQGISRSGEKISLHRLFRVR